MLVLVLLQKRGSCNVCAGRKVWQPVFEGQYVVFARFDVAVVAVKTTISPVCAMTSRCSALMSARCGMPPETLLSWGWMSSAYSNGLSWFLYFVRVMKEHVDLVV